MAKPYRELQKAAGLDGAEEHLNVLSSMWKTGVRELDALVEGTNAYELRAARVRALRFALDAMGREA